ncbi:MAG: hypothetical protein MJE68_14655, partial [Proteobacteria bacterium]|nr:hypothetical protein [Pseudomonadota bacterium]
EREVTRINLTRAKKFSFLGVTGLGVIQQTNFFVINIQFDRKLWEIATEFVSFWNPWLSRVNYRILTTF